MTEFDTRRQVFRELHREGCFVLPNPWDVGTARYLRHLGFSAIATTSAGYAFSQGVADGSVGRDEMLAHIKELVDATDLPVNADFENGYADDPDDVASNVRLCIATGVAGLSIEDAADRRDNSIYELPLAVERQLVNREPEHIHTLVEAVAPKPVNILLSGPAGLTGTVDLTMADAAALGVRRVSVGGALARAAWGGFIRAASELATLGRFDGFAGAAPHAQLQGLFAATDD